MDHIEPNNPKKDWTCNQERSSHIATDSASPCCARPQTSLFHPDLRRRRWPASHLVPRRGKIAIYEIWAPETANHPFVYLTIRQSKSTSRSFYGRGWSSHQGFHVVSTQYITRCRWVWAINAPVYDTSCTLAVPPSKTLQTFQLQTSLQDTWTCICLHNTSVDMFDLLYTNFRFLHCAWVFPHVPASKRLQPS